MCPGEMVLEDIHNTFNCKGIAFVARDGSTLASQLDQGVSMDTFAIMSATMLGAAATASREVGHTQLEKVVVNNSEGTVIVYPSGKRNLLVLVFDEVPVDLDARIGEHISNLEGF